MRKLKTIFTCSFCGYQAPKWIGHCPECDQWNTFYEETHKEQDRRPTWRPDTPSSQPVALSTVSHQQEENRIATGIVELDRVLGGGLVRGAAVLIGGDPGIGKSTLVLQALSRCAAQDLPVLYVSGEESLRQIRMRAQRIGTVPERLLALAETDLEAILEQIKNTSPALVVIDSVQTVYTADIESAPGSVSQIRECALRLITHAKHTDMTLLLIGHVTKEGAIAGPRVLEHMVDTVLYFEGDRGHAYRILRAVKNRFGSTDEIGVFEMSGAGLVEVGNPSEFFLAERSEQAPGSAVVPSIEGTRPILVEVQALTAPSPLALPRRTTIGLDQNRASVLVAVLEKKIGMTLYNQDVFLNVAGGIRLNDPGVDLGIIAAVVSSKLEQPMPKKTAICGEVGLTGEVRGISHVGQRLREAERLGFTQCIIPNNNLKHIHDTHSITVVGVRSVNEVIAHLFPTTMRKKRPSADSL